MAQTHTVGKTATTVRMQDNVLSVVYHQTEVVRADPERIILNTGGWKTATTKLRMNQAANQYGLDYYVSQHKGVWYVNHNGTAQEFTGDTITLDR